MQEFYHQPKGATFGLVAERSKALSKPAGRTVKRVYAKGALQVAPPSPLLDQSEWPPADGAGRPRVAQDVPELCDYSQQPTSRPCDQVKQRRVATWYAARNYRGTIQTAMFDNWYVLFDSFIISIVELLGAFGIWAPHTGLLLGNLP